MTSTRLKLIERNNFKVCRFCLHANADELTNFCGKAADDITATNRTINSVLSLLELEVKPNDTYSKLICINCRDTLISIHHFRSNAQKSIFLLEKAMARQPLELKVEVDMMEGVELPSVYEELVVSEEVLDETVKTEEKEEIEVAATMLEMSGSSSALNDSSQPLEPTTEPDDDDSNPPTPPEPPGPDDDSGGSSQEWKPLKYKKSKRPSPEKESEEAYLLDGYIPVQDVEFEFITKAPKPKKPKIRRPPKYLICTICGAQTTALAVHMRTHTDHRPFECDMCNLKFYTKGKLRCHRDSVHIGERNFPCEVCGKAFVLKKNLNAHMMSHTNKRDHVCPYCSKSFLFRWSLTAHERTHTGERPYACDYPECEKRFVTVSNLIQHQKFTNHIREAATEVCSLCFKAFQTKAALKAHRTKSHGTDILLENINTK